MKRSIFIQFSFLISFFFLLSVFKGWLNFSFWPLWVGAILGQFLPETDHLIYIFFLRPYELTSQRVRYLLKNGNIKGAIRLISETKEERSNLIFHNLTFEIILFILAFLVITSSDNLIGQGIVLSFLLHLQVSKLINFQKDRTVSIILGFVATIALGFLI